MKKCDSWKHVLKNMDEQIQSFNCHPVPPREQTSKNLQTMTMKIAGLFTLLAGSATAFAPAQSGKASNAIRMSFENEVGAQPPLGFYDPLGLLNDADSARFNRLRYVEVKHGRVSMLAVIGHIMTTGGVRLPGDIDFHSTSFESIPTGIAALSKVPAAGLLQMFLFIGLLEIAVMKDITGDGEFPGDFRNDFIDFGWYGFCLVLFSRAWF